MFPSGLPVGQVEGVFTAGCAGGARSDIRKTFPTAPATGKVCTLTVTGLQGGHSGVDINKGRANANKLLAECLDQLPGLRLISLRGGAQDNAIPGSAEAVFLLPAGASEGLRPSVRPDPELEERAAALARLLLTGDELSVARALVEVELQRPKGEQLSVLLAQVENQTSRLLAQYPRRGVKVLQALKTCRDNAVYNPGAGLTLGLLTVQLFQ